MWTWPSTSPRHTAQLPAPASSSSAAFRSKWPAACCLCRRSVGRVAGRILPQRHQLGLACLKPCQFPRAEHLQRRLVGEQRRFCHIGSPANLFPTQKGEPYTKSGLSSMWRRAKARAGITDDFTFKDIRALVATEAAKGGQDRKDIQTRLAHTSGKTTDIYIKEAAPDVSEIAVSLPWKG